VTRAHVAALCALVVAVVMTGAASGEPGDLFELRAGGSLDWVPTGGSIIVSSGSKLTESGVLTGQFGSAAFEASAGPGVARTSLVGSFTNPPLETRRLDPSTFARATTRLTVAGPDGVVHVRLKARVDATVLHGCPASFICGSGVTVFVGDHNTVVSLPGEASPNLLGLSVDPVPGGYRVHGDYVSPFRPVVANEAFDAILSIQLNVGNFGRGFVDTSTFDARGEVSFPATGTVLEVPSGYTVSGAGVEDNHWIDPFAPPPSPDIELRFADGTPIGSGDVLDLGTIASGAASPAASFTIANTGAAALDVQPLTAPAGFAIDDQPAGTVAPGATTTAGLTCGSTNAGTAPIVLDDLVTVASNDPDEPSLDLRVRCTVLPESPPEPDIELRDAGGTPLPLPHRLDLGDVASGSAAAATYLIANVGTGPLTIANITHDAPTGLGDATPPGAGSVQPGASTMAGVSCGGINPGEATLNVLFRVRVFSNDPDDSPADILVRCHVLPQPAPEIELRLADGSPLPADGVIDLGDTPSGVYASASLQVANLGTGPLTVIGTYGDFLDDGRYAIDTVTVFVPAGETKPIPAAARCGGNGGSVPFERLVNVSVRSDDPDEEWTLLTLRCRILPSDLSPPTISGLSDVTTDATGPAGAEVRYTVSATDNVDPAPQLSCLPASGSAFPIGTTTVSCTATDDSGNSASGSFTVTVRGAAAQIAALIAKTEAFVDSGALVAALRVPLRVAAQALAAGRKPVVCTALAAYILGVRAVPSRSLSGAEKAELIADATRIRALIRC
jgi:HYR domain